MRNSKLTDFLFCEGCTKLLPSHALLLCVPLLSASPTHTVGQSGASTHALRSDQVYLIIRSDDGGMSHSVNMALEKLIATGLPVSVSVIFPTPWYQETVDMLKHHPDVAVGIHLTLTSEWKNYRWGPVAGAAAVPTLIDGDGFLFASSGALDENHPDVRQVEKELRERLAKEYGPGMMGFFGDTRQNPQYEAAPRDKTDSVVAYVNRLRPERTTPFT